MDQVVRITKEPTVQMPTLLVKEKKPELAFLLSFLIFGAGQIYNEEYEKTLMHWIAGIGFITLAVTANDDSDDYFYILAFGNWLWSMIDAYESALRINEKIRERRFGLTPVKNPNQLGAKLGFRF